MRPDERPSDGRDADQRRVRGSHLAPDGVEDGSGRRRDEDRPERGRGCGMGEGRERHEGRTTMIPPPTPKSVEKTPATRR
jgi:hypothetical protein